MRHCACSVLFFVCLKLSTLNVTMKALLSHKHLHSLLHRFIFIGNITSPHTHNTLTNKLAAHFMYKNEQVITSHSLHKKTMYKVLQ